MRTLITLVLIAAALALGATTPTQPNPASPKFPAHNRDAKLLMTYSRSGGNGGETLRDLKEMPGLVFASWDDGWALARCQLRDDHGPLVALRFSKEPTERMKAMINASGAGKLKSHARGIAPDASHADLKVRVDSGVHSYMWPESLLGSIATTEERAFAAMWIACTSIVVSEAPEEILDEKTFLKGGAFRGLNPNGPTMWPADDAK